MGPTELSQVMGQGLLNHFYSIGFRCRQEMLLITSSLLEENNSSLKYTMSEHRLPTLNEMKLEVQLK